MNTFKRCLSNFLNSSRKQENAHESRRINLTTVFNNLEPIFTTWMALPEITMTTFNSRSPTYFLPLPPKVNMEITHPEALKPLIKREDGNPAFRNKYYKMPLNIQAGDFDFIYNDNTVIKSDNIHCDDSASKLMFTLQESQELKINRTIERESTDNLSICTTGKNLDSSSSAKSELRTLKIKQQESRDQFELQDNQYSRKYDSSQSPEFPSYTRKDLSSTTKQQIPFLQAFRSVLRTPTNISEPSLFETSKRSNAIMKTQECMKDAAKLSAFAKIEIPRNISSKWSSMKRSFSRKEYHTWKTCKIENIIKYDGHRFFVSDMHTSQQEQSAGYRSSRFDHLVYSRNSGNQGSRKTSSCLPFVSRRVFSSKSCTVIQQSIREFENLRKDLNANASIVLLRSTRLYPDRVPLMKLQSFSCDASKSKKFSDCEDEKYSQREVEEDYDASSQEVARSRCRIESKKICGKTRQKDTCVSSQDDVEDDVGEKQRERKSKLSKNYICPELTRQKPCTWEEERCPETRRKCDANKARVSSRNRARQSRDLCSQKQDIDRRHNKRRQSKANKQRGACEKADEPQSVNAVCKDSMKKTEDFESKCKNQRSRKCNINKKERRKCTGNSRKRSNSCRKRNSPRNSDKSYSKVDGRRCYSTSDVTKQSIFSVPRDRKSFSTLISDIVLGTNVNKRFYASCNKDEKGRRQAPSCEKRKMKCETKKKEEIQKKCVKGPAKCMSRKKAEKTQTCQSTKKDKDRKFCESTKKSRQEEFCTSRKKEFKKADEKVKKEPIKTPPPPIKDKKSMEQLMKEQIDREYKEIDECKKGFKKEKKENKVKMVSTEHKPTGLDRIINSCKKQEKQNSEKFASTPNESIISTDAVFKWFNIQSRIVNSTIPIIAKHVRLFNVMSDRSFSTAKLDYQDDFTIERTMNDDKMVQNCSANGDDFIHGDELPNYVEIEYDDEEDDVND